MRHIKNLALIALTTTFMTPALSFAEQEQDPTRIHKDNYVEYCISRDKPKAFCQCNMTMVNAMVEKRKANLKKIIAANKNMRNNKGRMFILQKNVKNVAELDAICTLIEQQENGQISDAEYGEKTATYKTNILQRIKADYCTLPEHETKTIKEYEDGEYNYVNAAYIMTNDNQCKTHLRK